LKRIVKGLLIGAGTLFVGLGLLGMFLPLLPTTPFLLLAAFCFARSSDRFYQWLMTNRLFGEYIRNYREGRGIALKHKVIALTLLWTTIGYAAWFLVPVWWGKAGLIAIAVGVTIHLVMVKTLRNQKMTGKKYAATPEESG
jgi:uncharacterized membrane protein YbaN (DUF454 family)